MQTAGMMTDDEGGGVWGAVETNDTTVEGIVGGEGLYGAYPSHPLGDIYKLRGQGYTDQSRTARSTEQKICDC